MSSTYLLKQTHAHVLLAHLLPRRKVKVLQADGAGRRVVRTACRQPCLIPPQCLQLCAAVIVLPLLLEAVAGGVGGEAEEAGDKAAQNDGAADAVSVVTRGMLGGDGDADVDDGLFDGGAVPAWVRRCRGGGPERGHM